MNIVIRSIVAVALSPLLLSLSACGERNETGESSPTRDTIAASPSSITPTPTDTSIDLLDPQIPDTIAGGERWGYQQSVTADLDGDGTAERAILIADVQRSGTDLLWEDGHRWQLYIEEPDSTRTYLYKRFIQLGKAEAVLARGADNRPAIILIERAPQQIAVYEIRYDGPAKGRATERLRREIYPQAGFK
jgi:hypothetical protein